MMKISFKKDGKERDLYPAPFTVHAFEVIASSSSMTPNVVNAWWDVAEIMDLDIHQYLLLTHHWK